MNREYAQYDANIKMVNQLIRPKFPAGASRAEILSAIRTGAEQVARLKAWNDRFLNEFIYGRDPASISPEEKDDLIELADTLFRNGRANDAGVAYRIHNLLDAYAIAHNDRDLHIRELYYQGLLLNSFHLFHTELGINLQGETIHRYFAEGASYMKDYEQITSEETRAYILRCLGNQKYGVPEIKGDNNWQRPHEMALGYRRYMKIFNEAMAVFQSEKYQKMNPNLPWDTYQYAMHFDRTIYLQAARSKTLRKTMPDLYHDVVTGVLESAEYVYRHQEESARLKHQAIGTRTLYVYATARYHAGQLGMAEVLNIILSGMEGADEDDYSSSGIINNFNMPVYAKVYFDAAPEDVRQAFQPRIQAALDHMYRYLRNFPSGNSIDPRMAKLIADLTTERIVQDEGFRDHMMNYLVMCHAPTCVHSRMVAMLAQTMMERLIRVNPAALVGVLGTASVEEVIQRGEELLSRAYRCGLYHDIGKNDVINYITVYGRRLLDEEFAAIQFHPVMGHFVLKNFYALPEESEVALRHHLYYDENGGYPSNCPPCPPSSKMLVDLVTVADSMDAATDNVGRSYAASKSFHTLLKELRARSGTRYSPAVVALFDNGDFAAELERTLIRNRQEIYYSVYRSMDGPESSKLIPPDIGA